MRTLWLPSSGSLNRNHGNLTGCGCRRIIEKDSYQITVYVPSRTIAAIDANAKALSCTGYCCCPSRAISISVRSVYRDIASLQAQGAHIDGEAGLGYILKPGFVLPPLMFTQDEIEALVLGARWVANRADSRLGDAAQNVIAKIEAVIPLQLQHELQSNALLIGPTPTGQMPDATRDQVFEALRVGIRRQSKTQFEYCDAKDVQSTRTVWPFAIGFFDSSQVLVAWCELRKDVRHFRIDRITHLKTLQDRYPKPRQALLKMWRQQQGIEPTDRI